MHHVFVYGSLMEGMGNERILQSYDYGRIPGTVSNMDLYVVDKSPAMVAGEGVVKGELLSFTDDAFEDLIDIFDSIGGYHQGNIEESKYRRDIVTVDTSEGIFKAFAYIWNKGTESLIKVGGHSFDYREYLKMENFFNNMKEG